jgi:hypothetical protein
VTTGTSSPSDHDDRGAHGAKQDASDLLITDIRKFFRRLRPGVAR